MLCVCGVLLMAGISLASNKAKDAGTKAEAGLFAKGSRIERNRIDRSEIPPIDVHTMVYRELFNDTNATQLASAIRNGIHDPSTFGNPAESGEMVLVESNRLFWLDTMHYSMPYLVPEAKLLLMHIATRFQEEMKENYPDDPHTYRLVVTSCFRSQEHVDRLVRCNRNASENSCHRYGTTMDISYKRFITEQGDTVNELFLKQMLAKALYELRYEGLCWVKYEHRQACFHLTLRNIEYTGRQKSQSVTYNVETGKAERRRALPPTKPAAIAESGGRAASVAAIVPVATPSPQAQRSGACKPPALYTSVAERPAAATRVVPPAMVCQEHCQQPARTEKRKPGVSDNLDGTDYMHL